MKKASFKILLLLVGIIVIIFLLNFLGLLFFLNQPLNQLIAGAPAHNRYCAIDTDCKAIVVDCGICSCSREAVRTGWAPFCPFRKTSGEVMCKPCISLPVVKCIEGQCRVVSQEIVPPQSATPSPDLPVGENIVITGIVVENSRACIVDGGCALTLSTQQGLVEVIYGFGENISGQTCANKEVGKKGLEIENGQKVEVFGKVIDENSISPCDSQDFYIKKKLF